MTAASRLGLGHTKSRVDDGELVALEVNARSPQGPVKIQKHSAPVATSELSA